MLDTMYAKGEEALERAAALLAKAKGSLEHDLDADFAEYDRIRQASDEAAEAALEDEDDEEEVEDAGEAAASMPPARPTGKTPTQALRKPGVVQDEDAPTREPDLTDADAEAPEEVMAKADELEPVDAGPILQALDNKLTQLQALDKKLDAVLAKAASVELLAGVMRQLYDALNAQQEGLATLAKAQSALADLPRVPKSQPRHVNVPTGAPQRPIGDLFAKACDLADAVQVGVLTHYYHRGDVDGLLSALTPEQRAQVLKD